MRYIKILLTGMLLFNISPVYADDWDDIRKAAEDIKYVRADFTQEKHMKILTKPLVSKGKFLFSAPGSLRWEYTSPVRSILLVHNGNLKSFIEGKNGLIEDTKTKAQAMSIVMQEITLWLKGRFNDDPNFRASLSTTHKDRIILTPKEKALSDIIESLEIDFSRKEKTIKSVRITESRESYTLIKFTSADQNTDVDEKVFREI